MSSGQCLAVFAVQLNCWIVGMGYRSRPTAQFTCLCRVSRPCFGTTSTEKNRRNTMFTFPDDIPAFLLRGHLLDLVV